jgi:ribose-phosphate pyrophosphokinase
MDFHSEQLSAAVNVPVDIVYASHALIPRLTQIEDLTPENLVVISPDAGERKRARGYQQRIGAVGVGSIDKQRDTKTGITISHSLDADVTKKDVLLVDDMAVSLNSLRDASVLAAEKGARRVFAAIAHGIFVRSEQDDSLKNLEHSPIFKLFVTDSIMQPKEVKSHPKIEVVSTIDFWTKVIYWTYYGISLSSQGLFD